MKKKLLKATGMLLMMMVVGNLFSQIAEDGDYRTKSTGNWDNASTWQTRSSSTWSDTGTPPSSANNIYVQEGHTITINVATAACKNLNANKTGVIEIGANTLEVSGKLRAYTGTAIIAIGADDTFYSGQTSTSTLNSSFITSSSGKLSVVGNSRVLTNTGEWGATSTGFAIEINMNSGQTATAGTGLKAKSWNLVSGIFDVGSNSLSADDGTNGGDVTVGVNAILISNASSNYVVQRTGSLGNPASSFIINGQLFLTGVSPIIQARTIAFNGTVEYGRSGAQTLVIDANSISSPLSYSTLILSGNNSKTLGVSAIVSSVLHVDPDPILIIPLDMSLALSSTCQATISGTLTNSAGTSGLVIESDIVGTGSLIGGGSVDVTIQRYFTGSSWDWHLISSPVVDQAIQNEFVPEVFTANEDFYTWYEPTSIYVNFKNSTTPPTWVTANVDNNFIEGKGYMIAYQATNPSKSFAGVLNNGEQTVAITKTGTDTYSGSNLVGNPYPSSIDWKAVSGWTRTSLVSNGGGYDMYIWNQTANNFGTFNSAGTTGTNSVTQYIPPMQGFFVSASDNGNLIMDNNVRVHDGASNWLKNTETTGNILKILVTSEENYGSDEAILEFDHESAIGGAAKMFSFLTTAPSIFLKKQSKEYSISFLNSISENNIVPVSFQAGADGNYNLIFYFDSLDYIQLLDKKTNLKYNLKDAPHFSFSALVEDNSDRFEIHFSPVGIEESTELNQINAYVYNNNLYVQNNPGEAQISLYDIQGRQMYSEQLNCTGLHRKELSLPTGIYIVRLQSNNQVKNIKVFIN